MSKYRGAFKHIVFISGGAFLLYPKIANFLKDIQVATAQNLAELQGR